MLSYLKTMPVFSAALLINFIIALANKFGERRYINGTFLPDSVRPYHWKATCEVRFEPKAHSPPYKNTLIRRFFIYL